MKILRLLKEIFELSMSVRVSKLIHFLLAVTANDYYLETTCGETQFLKNVANLRHATLLKMSSSWDVSQVFFSKNIFESSYFADYERFRYSNKKHWSCKNMVKKTTLIDPKI